MNLRKTHLTINKKVIKMDFYDKDLEQALIKDMNNIKNKK